MYYQVILFYFQIRQQSRSDFTSLKNSLEINKKIQALLQDEISRVRYLLSQNRETQVSSITNINIKMYIYVFLLVHVVINFNFQNEVFRFNHCHISRMHWIICGSLFPHVLFLVKAYQHWHAFWHGVILQVFRITSVLSSLR